MGVEGFFAAATDAFAAASRRFRPAEHHILVAGRPLRLRIAGPALDAMVEPAFRHLAAPPAAPDLDVVLWAESETGVALPAAPWVADGAPGPAAVRLAGERFSALAEYGGSQHWMLDRTSGRAVLCIRDLATMPYWDRLSPLRLLLAAWAGSRGLRMLHAGGVGFDGRGAMVVGRGGSGKSTTVLACLRDGGRAVGDDLLLVDGGDRPAMHSIYGTARLFADHAARFPELMPGHDSADPAEDGALKLTSYLSLRTADLLVPRLALAAIIVPRVVGAGETRLAPLGGAAALAALAPSTLGHIDRFDRAAFHDMSRLCRMLPAFDLAIGADVSAIPGAVRAGLARSAS